MRIVITQKDIDNGLRGEGRACPIALSLKRRIHGVDFAVITRDIRFQPKHYSVYQNVAYVPLPQKAVEFIRMFDEGAFVKPMFFELDIETVRRAVQNVRGEIK